ncbi:MAG: methylmalonyl-CoA mutase [Deltaproteobacteria bacterium]|nr:methylmalonyl-CoA mutase [Deltaproteobacteria bacterium]MBW1948050.1 methylmalonyl-CoA mutase [Deltaproteobacteria bacterium]MBW2348629.1 methylmalonyl-CoA mutase [Deltaproteobacteria bacterium]
MADAYHEKPADLETWSGLPLKEFYSPDDISGFDYKMKIGNPGDYPYTRGIHRNMFRGRYWTRREVSGYGTPEDTNERLKYLVAEGASGLNVIPDNPSIMGIDSDHPRASGEVGVQGVPMCTLQDMELLMRDMPLEKISMSLIASSTQTPVALSQYIALAQSKGFKPGDLAGTTQNDPVHCRYAGFRISSPIDLALKTGVDVIEYCTRHMPRWYPINVNMYDLREQGLTAPQELAFGFSMAILYIQGVLERGLDIDEFAPRFAFYCSAHIDFFEEIAKLRAARRIWAKIMKERFGAKDPRSWKFKFGVHTAGCSLVPHQARNNIIRVAYQALAAVLAGVQSLHCCSYDEPIALPTEESVRLAIRTQQILAYETGVARVADPLGGSYYIESLTEQIEHEAVRIMEAIDGKGGMKDALESGWIDAQMDEASLRYQREVENEDRIVVGLNRFRIEEDPRAGDAHRVNPEAERLQVSRLKLLKESRDENAVKESLREIKLRAEAGEHENLIPAMIEAARNYATLAEVLGTVRVAMGEPYDPFEIVSHPFF